MKFQNREIIFLASMVSVAVAALSALYADIYLFSERATTKEIGTIYFKENTAERKLAAQSLWNPIANSAPVYNYDSIRTEAESSAIIKLDGGIEIDIGQNTLIVLNMNNDRPEIQLQSGDLSAKSAGNLQVTSDKLEAVVENGEIRLIKNQDGDLSLDSTAQSATVVIDGKETVLNKEQILELAKNGKTVLKEVQFVLENPPASASYVTSQKTQNIRFAWTARNNESTTQNVIISKQSDFSKIDYKLSGKKELAASLPAGLYYWKVIGTGGESNVQKFRIFQDSGPVPLLPQANASVSYVSSPPLISFQWRKGMQDKNMSSVSQVEIYSDPELKNSIKTFQSYSESISTDTLSQGSYFWRVVSLYPDSLTQGEKEIASAVRKLNIQQTENLDAPEILQDNQEIVVSEKMLDDRTPVLQWKENPNVDYYTVEIARDKEFKKIEASQKVTNNYYAPPANLKEGKYFWRVKAHAGKEKEKTSSVKELLVQKNGTLDSLLPPAESSFFSKTPIHFSWNDSDRSNRYALEFSHSPSFEQIFSTTPAGREKLMLDNLPMGEIHWRVNSFDKNKNVLLKSKPSKLIVKDRQQPLTLHVPKENNAVDVSYNDSVFFQWEKRKEADAYRIKVYSKIADVDNTIYEKIVSQNTFATFDLPMFREIDYTWEVTALKRRGGEYTQISETAYGHFSIVLSQKLFFPKIQDPGTAFIYEK